MYPRSQVRGYSTMVIMNILEEEHIRRIVRDEIEIMLDGQSRSVQCECCQYDGSTWTTKQVAEFMGLSTKTILNRISLGTFPAPKKQGRLNAFDPKEIRSYRDTQLSPHRGPLARRHWAGATRTTHLKTSMISASVAHPSAEALDQ